MKRVRVRFSRAALTDFSRLAAFVHERSADEVLRVEPTLRVAVDARSALPHLGRPARGSNDPSLRELIVPFGRWGYVILYRLTARGVDVLTARYQREEPLR